MATSANQPTPTMMAYTESAADRSTTPPSTYTFTAKPTVDSDLSYDQISSFRQGSAGGRYTVRGGDTLQTIAQAVWGDASLWYKIAEANGLSGDALLVDGQSLNLPSGVTRSKNNASTFKPYDAAETLGNTSPTAPKPPKKKGCGMMGMVLIAVIAIAVTAITAGAALAAATPGLSLSGGITAALGGTATLASGAAFTGGLVSTFGVVGGMAIGAGAAALGSVVSQGVGVATGLQDKFSWKGVALSALAGGIGAGLGGTNVFDKMGIGGKVAGSQFLGNVARGAVTSAITQGIALATNLQDKFDWAGVAAAGVAAGVGGAVGKEVSGWGVGEGAGKLMTSGASLIASGATRSLLNGSNFGDNVLAGLPDVIGQTIGGIIADGVSGRTTSAPAAGDSDGAAAEPVPSENGGQPNYLTDPIVFDPMDLGPDLSAYIDDPSGSTLSSSEGMAYFAGPLGLAAVNGSIPISDLMAGAALAGRAGGVSNQDSAEVIWDLKKAIQRLASETGVSQPTSATIVQDRHGRRINKTPNVDYDAINRSLGTEIDFDSVTGHEGGVYLDSYVPWWPGAVRNNSGVTLVGGLDLGSKNRSYFSNAGVDGALIDEIAPAFGKHKADALAWNKAHPIRLTVEEGNILQRAVSWNQARNAGSDWNRFKASGLPSFGDLTPAQQTVFYSRYFHGGKGKMWSSFYTEAYKATGLEQQTRYALLQRVTGVMHRV